MTAHLPFVVGPKKRRKFHFIPVILAAVMAFFIGHYSAMALDFADIPHTCEYRHVNQRSLCHHIVDASARASCKSKATEDYKLCAFHSKHSTS